MAIPLSHAGRKYLAITIELRSTGLLDFLVTFHSPRVVCLKFVMHNISLELLVRSCWCPGCIITPTTSSEFSQANTDS